MQPKPDPWWDTQSRLGTVLVPGEQEQCGGLLKTHRAGACLAGIRSSYLVEMGKHTEVLNWRVQNCPSVFSPS